MEFWTNARWKYEFENGKLVPKIIQVYTIPAKGTYKSSKTKKKVKKEYKAPEVNVGDVEEVDFG